MRNLSGATSADLLDLMLEFKRAGGVFTPKTAATFLARLSECFDECGQLETSPTPVQPFPTPMQMTIRLIANDNNRGAV